jgi:hypothetical protein
MKRLALLVFFVSLPAFSQNTTPQKTEDQQNEAFYKALREFNEYFKERNIEIEEKKMQCLRIFNYDFCKCIEDNERAFIGFGLPRALKDCTTR